MPSMGCFMPSSFNVQSASAYEQLMGRWSKILALPFLEFTGLKEGERILDVGCGNGSLTFALAETAGLSEIVAIDYSALFVEEATRLNTDLRIKIRQGCLRPAVRGPLVRPRAVAAGAPFRARSRQSGQRDAPCRTAGRDGRGSGMGPSGRHARHAHDGGHGCSALAKAAVSSATAIASSQ
jgi:Methyltransferase domain